MRVAGLNHFSIATADLEKSAEFYENLGLVRGHRPKFSTTGIWMYVGDHPIVHLNDEAEVGPIVKGIAAVHHVGFSVHGAVEEITDRLDFLEIDYDLWDPIPGVCRALYFMGPSGETIEFVMVDNMVPAIPFNQTCPCGSGKQKQPNKDARGIFLCYTCEDCHDRKMSGYRRDVLTDPNYWADEPIEGD